MCKAKFRVKSELTQLSLDFEAANCFRSMDLQKVETSPERPEEDRRLRMVKTEDQIRPMFKQKKLVYIIS